MNKRFRYDPFGHKKYSWTPERIETLKTEASRCSNFRQLGRAMGYGEKNTVNDYLLTKIIQFGIDISHFKGNRHYTIEELNKAIKYSKTWKKVGLKLKTKSNSTMRLLANKYGINTSHFKYKRTKSNN